MRTVCHGSFPAALDGAVLPVHSPSEVLFTDVLHGPVLPHKLWTEHAHVTVLECSCHCMGAKRQ